ncbi:MAG: ThuA domain-containing protein, partial [Candidatus Hydrogenedens sp.]
DKEPFEAMWASIKDIKPEYFDYAGGKCVFFDNDKYKDFDTIVLYNFHHKISKKQQKNFLDMLNSGKKIIVMHHALSAFPDWNEFSKIIGAKYFLEDMEWEGKKYERSKYKHDIKIPVHVVDKNHPITQGVEDFEEIDEVYSQFYISPDVHVLLTTNHPDSASFLAWVNKYSNSEVFFMQLGHGPQIFANEQFRKLISNAIKWSVEKNK